jgi:hypothetical protein
LTALHLRRPLSPSPFTPFQQELISAIGFDGPDRISAIRNIIFAIWAGLHYHHDASSEGISVIYTTWLQLLQINFVWGVSPYLGFGRQQIWQNEPNGVCPPMIKSKGRIQYS